MPHQATLLTTWGGGQPSSSRPSFQRQSRSTLLQTDDLLGNGLGGCDTMSEADITVVTDHDPVLPDVSLEIDLENEIVLDSTEALGTGTYGSVFSGLYRGHPVAVKFAQKSIVDGLIQKVGCIMSWQHSFLLKCRLEAARMPDLGGAEDAVGCTSNGRATHLYFQRMPQSMANGSTQLLLMKCVQPGFQV